MPLNITHAEKPTEENPIDDDKYMLPHLIEGSFPNFWGDPIQTHNLDNSLAVTLSDLDGETDGIYKITGDFVISGDGEIYHNLKPNNITTLQGVKGFRAGSYYSYAGSLIASAPTNSAVDDELHYVHYYIPKTGTFRYGYGRSIWIDESKNDMLPFYPTTFWREKTTAITSLVIENLYSGRVTGELKLYKAPFSSVNFW